MSDKLKADAYPSSLSADGRESFEGEGPLISILKSVISIAGNQTHPLWL